MTGRTARSEARCARNGDCSRRRGRVDGVCCPPRADFYGTAEPFASEAVYFVLTDRFVDGDPANNHRDQGGANRSFDRPLVALTGVPDNIGYLGGDFKGILDNAAYIREMGFTAVWITPIVDNPDEAFTGGNRIGEGFFADRGKTGYHGYWGVNFYRVDEHLESEGLQFADFTRRMRDEHGLKVVLDIVCNHGSPSYTMPVDQPGFGEIYDASGRLRADHQNLPPGKLDPANPLHRWFRREPDLAELSNFDDTNPEVMDYLVGAYLQWIDQGASAFRIEPSGTFPIHSGASSASASARGIPGSSCSGKASTTTPARSPRIRGRKTAASASSTSR